ncbi:hypothetical protein [Tabrizicola sp.]|uniref:hypothetical protein n=1 Tax=Tabrizicola sp. TaxID=2005166 RepID=UPI0035AE8C50
MQRIVAKVGLVRAFCLALVLALAIAPAVEAAHHGPGALAAEADHHSHGPGHDHDHGGQPHDSGDHDHVSVALLTGDGATTYPQPGRLVQPSPGLRNGTPPDGPRRPPRPMMI